MYLDTQEILTGLEKMAGAQLVSDSSKKIIMQSGEVDYALKETQGIQHTGEDIIKHIQADDTLLKSTESKDENDNSWMKEVKDPFPDGETPWLNKIKDPFQETPTISKIHDHADVTPQTISKIKYSSFTPTGHKIFEKLRGEQERPELEVETQTQSAPNLIFNSLTQSPLQLRTQLSDGGLYHNSAETQMDSPMIKLHKLRETYSVNEATQHDIPNNNNNYDNDPDISSIVELDTRTSEMLPSQPKSQADGTQDDIQVLGTAPDNNSFPDSQDLDLNIETMKETFDGEIQINENTNSENISSPVVSDDESDPVSIQKSICQTGSSYMLAEDSIQKYHRDFQKKEIPSPSKRFNFSYSSSNHLVHSQPLNNSKLIKFNSQRKLTESRPIISLSQSYVNHPARSNTNLGLERINYRSDESKSNEKKSQNEFSDLGANITQELSDIDDDSKVNNTIEEEEPASSSKTKDDDEYDMPKFVRKSKRKMNNIISSPEYAKKSKIDESLNEKSLSLNDISPAKSLPVLDYDYSTLTTIGSTPNGDLANSTFDRTLNPKPLPTDLLTEETSSLTELDIAFKEYVWCQYNAQYYPGIIKSVNDKGFNVKFIADTANMSMVYPLDLRINDHIVVETSKYVVIGLKCLELNEDVEIIRCMRGYDTVIAKRLKKTKSKTKKKSDKQEFEFPIGLIKIDNDEWFKRERVGSDSFTKPRRNFLKDSTHHNIIPTYQDELLISTPQKIEVNTVNSGIFDSCLFVITGEVDKAYLIDLIETHGGSVLDDGFSSLLQFESNVDNEVVIKNKKSLKQFDFAALISNKHTRSPKYLATLALGWPLLSTSFINDSIKDNKLKCDFLTTYLLPAGESKKMKFIKSHNIHKFINNLLLKQDLTQQLKNNRSILKDRYVILTSSNPEIIKFIFYTLGAKKIFITAISNQSNLIKILTKISKFDNCEVMIYNEKIKTLESLDIFDKNKKANQSNLNLNLELVDWEWVVQCLIDGYPWPSKIKRIE